MTEYTVVNYLIEYSARGGPWLTWPLGAEVRESEVETGSWRKYLPGPGRGKNTRFRLVKRTAVITDEILDEMTGD